MGGAQEAPARFETKDYADIAHTPLFNRWDGDFDSLSSGGIRAMSAEGGPVTESEAREHGSFIKYEVVGDESALSISISFSDFDLGSNSFIQIVGTEGDIPQVQWFDQKTLAAWEGSSALFNGAYVDLFFFASADDPCAFYEIDSIDVGRPQEEAASNETMQQNAIPGEEAICSIDDRQRSAGNRMGRIMPVGCTGWMESSGRFLTAGHCADGGRMKFLQFEVPASNSDGTPNHPAIENQYRVIGNSVTFENGGIGNDWAVFDVAPSLGQDSPHA